LSDRLQLLVAGGLPLGAALLLLWLLGPGAAAGSCLLCWTYRPAFTRLLRRFPGSFTAGEAAIVTQAALIALAAVFLRLANG